MQGSTYVRAMGCLLLVAAAASSGQAGMNRQQAGGLVSVSDGPSLRTQVRPAVAKAPAEVRIEVWIASHALNRTLEIEVGGDDFYRGPHLGTQGRAVRHGHRSAGLLSIHPGLTTGSRCCNQQQATHRSYVCRSLHWSVRATRDSWKPRWTPSAVSTG